MVQKRVAWVLILSAVLVIGLLYQNVQLRWYREQSVELQAAWIGSSLRTAHDHLTAALTAAEQGEIDRAAEEISAAEVQLERANMADAAYEVSLGRRDLTGSIRTGSTGLSAPLRLYAGLLRSTRQGIERRGWSAEDESALRSVAQELAVMREIITEEVLVENNADRIMSKVEELRERLRLGEPR